MAPKSIAAQQNHIDCENDRANADPKRILVGGGIDKPKRFPHVNGEDDDEDQRKIKKIAVHVLHDERKRPFAEISFARIYGCARRRVRLKRFVVRAAFIVTSEPKQERRTKMQ